MKIKTFMDEIGEIYQESNKKMSDPAYHQTVLENTKKMQDEVHAYRTLEKMIDFYNEKFPYYKISLVNK